MNKRGQSIIEYLLIAVLVILGIVIMGPYVLRSIDAHFKLWNDGAEDSFEEHLTQAPIANVPPINPNCTCTTVSNCGSLTSYCGANQMESDYTCNPVGCHATTACVDDPCCCTASPIKCGQAPIPTASEGGIPTGSPCGSNFLPAGTTCTTTPPSPYPLNAICVPPPTSDPTDCYFGYHIWGNECGSSDAVQCIQDPSCPGPLCTGIPSPGSKPCLNEQPPAITLLQNTPVSYVGGASDCNTPCQYYCAPGYVLNSSQTACINQFTVAVNVSSCSDTGACSGCHQSGNNTINDCSFSMCADPGVIISAVSVTDVSVPPVAPYCGNPGNPGETCQVSFTYGE